MSGHTEVKFPMDFYGVEELGRAIKKVRTLRGMMMAAGVTALLSIL